MSTSHSSPEETYIAPGLYLSGEFCGLPDEACNNIQAQIGHSSALGDCPQLLLEEHATDQRKFEEAPPALSYQETGKRLLADVSYLGHKALKDGLNLGLDGVFGIVGRIGGIMGIQAEDV